MKKLLFFGMMGAIALTFTACTESEDIAEVNPTYDPVAKTVNTQFVLNVASPASQKTRMEAATVQKSEKFRGIEDARIFLFNTGNNDGTFLAPYCAIDDDDEENSQYLKSIELGTLYPASFVSNSGDDNKNNSSRRVLELAMPLTADAALIYGRAIRLSGDNWKASNGYLVTNFETATKPSEIEFNLQTIVADDDTKTRILHTQNLIAAVFNRLFLTSIGAESSTGYYGPGSDNDTKYSSTAALPAISWKGLTEVTGRELTPLEEIMADAYKTLTTIGPETSGQEYRAGSANAVLTQVYYIRKMVDNIKNALPTNDYEANAWRLAEELNNRCSHYFDEFTSPTTVKFHQALGSGTNTLQYYLKNTGNYTDEDFTGTGQFAGVLDTELATFPLSFGLPAGSALMTFDATNLFSYVTANNSLIQPFEATTSVDKYKNPAELYYYDNSALYCSDVEKTADDFPNGYDTWDNYEWSTNNFTNWTVSSTTRSVAVKSNINYGVSMLQTKVAVADATFEDNKHKFIDSEENQAFTADDIKKLTLTGVLIGGQPDKVGWPYIAMHASPTFNDIVYDNVIPNSGKIPTETDKEVYTLLLDNMVMPATATQSNVYVALEFRNTMEKDFYGKHNLVRQNGIFYLVAKLELPTSPSITWDDNYAIPPYDRSSGKTNGQSLKIPRIFIQDYMTTATFKIGAQSLKNAFVTVPDLRATQTSMALSVDLNWRQGIDFGNIDL